MNPKVLVVDDTPEDRALAIAVLGWQGYRLTEAGNGMEALTAIERERPDLIITDLLMPEMDGFQLAHRVSLLPEPIRVVFYSATYNVSEAMSLGSLCGVSGVIAKPAEPADIMAAVERALASPLPHPHGTARDFNQAHIGIVNEKTSDALMESRANADRLRKLQDFGAQLLTAKGWAGVARALCGAVREMALATEAAVGIYQGASGIVIQESTGGAGIELAGFARADDEPGTATEGEAARALASRMGIDARHTDVLAVPLDTPAGRHGWLCVAGKVGGGRFTAKDGEVIAALVAQAALAQENSERLAELSRRTGELAREIAERTRVESELRQAEWGKSLALEAARASVWQHDIATDQSGRLSASAAFATLLSGVLPEDRPQVEDALERALASGDDFTVEFRASNQSGVERWTEARGHIVRDAGLPTRILGISIDITERKSLESQFREAQKIEAIGTLAGGVAHDFNNMLTAILGFNELLSNRDLDPEARAEADEVRNAAERAAALTRQLLAFSRRQVMKPEAVDLTSLVSQVAPMLRRLIGEDIELVTVAPPVLDRVLIDAGQWDQVLMNLVINARQAMPDGGRITIELAAEHHDAAYCAAHPGSAEGPHVVLRVTDNGTGMDARTRRRIFEPFFTTRPQGTGLGLSTVFGIVKQSGGDIEVSSEQGRGTAFTIRLPACSGSTDVPAVEHPGGGGFMEGRGTVLLAEDEPAIRVFASRVLERAGYRVIVAPDGVGARDAAADQPIDLLVTDVLMPGESGPSLYAALRARHPDLKVLFISGLTVEHPSLSEHIGVGELLQKPFSAAALTRHVRAALCGGTAA